MTEVPRDRYDRPLIMDPETGLEEAYTRASTMAKATDDQGGLITWMGGQVLKGLVARPDLYEIAKTMTGDKAKLKNIVDKAKDAASTDAAANTGTTIHWWCEQLDTGRATIDDIPGPYLALLTEYLKVTAHLEMVACEQFVVNDELKVAGTFDRLIRLPDGAVVVGDIKTGRWSSTYGATSVAMQCSIYAHSKRYDPDTGERTELHPDLDMSRGMLIHMPADGDEVTLFELDGDLGWRGAKVARLVLDWRKMRPIKAM